MTARRLLAVASGGGHWEELMIVAPSFAGFALTYATTNPAVAGRVDGDVRIIADCNRQRPRESLKCAIDAFRLVRSLRPHVVVTTGAAPGAIVLVIARLFGAKTIWIDSLASASRLSMSGRMTRPFAHLHLTQWPHLADGRRTRYMGSAL